MISCSPVFTLLILPLAPSVWAADRSVTGKLTDPQGKSVAAAKLRLVSGHDSNPVESVTDPGGQFVFSSLAEGTYQLSAMAAEFAEVKKRSTLATLRRSRWTFSSLAWGREPIRLP
jgi:hypothetical protein